MSEIQADRPMIDVRSVTKRFGRLTAVDHVSFTLSAGESVALWGSNGAGKTTLIRCMLGMTGYAGEIVIDGLPSATRGKQVRSRVGYVPQMMPMFDMSVGEMVHLIATLRGVTANEGGRLLEQFGLLETIRVPVRSLSGGMRQKLALTLALLGSPPVLLFDEPTANLDAATQGELLRMLNQLKNEGRTLVFTSHRWSEVRALADTVIHLEKGKVVEAGAVRDLAIVTDRVSLRVALEPGDVATAQETLHLHGFETMRNGSDLLVSVQDRHKMEPLRVVMDAGIAIRTFDLEVEE